MTMGGIISEKEVKQFHNYYHHIGGRSIRGGDQYGGDIFFNEGDNCVFSYQEEHPERNSEATTSSNRCKHKLLVVANRLPVSATRKGKDSWQLEISVGGLVSALSGLEDLDARWIGWAGVNVPDEVGKQSLTKALAEKKCIPVFLDEETFHQYYNGYCNKILWPLLHYFGLPQEDRLATTRGIQSQFDAYRNANQGFADVVCKHYNEGDIVWCHDYHLMYLPQFLKEYDSAMKVGWFLHTPFPSSEIVRTLPSRSQLLRSVLSADIVGFHTYDYARHFVSACTRILGVEGTLEGVDNQGRLTRVAAFPVGIDSERFTRALELQQVQDYMKDLRQRFAGRKVMLGVDRLDMIKGIPQKILAFEKFLEENPDWCDKVVLLQIAVPTRTDVPEYQKLTSQVHEIVGRINGRFGSLTSVPIHHLDRSLDFTALCALYAVTDVALVTSLRDGMNLVSYEFVACQASKKGVLILSEFAGAAQSLGAGAILVNPWNISEVAISIHYALNMPSDEREKRHQLNYEYVTNHTAREWAGIFVSELIGTTVEAQVHTTQVRPSLPLSLATENYSRSDHRLLVLGFNATMTQSVKTKGTACNQIKDMELNLHPELHDALRKISNDPNTTTLVMSGSVRDVLDENFSGYNLWLAAENGIFLRHTNGDWMTTMPECVNLECVDSIKHVFEYFTERTPRSYFEQRETSLLWSFKYADIEFGRIQARDLLQHLWTGPIANSFVDIFQGATTVEVRAAGVTKGVAMDRILGEIVHQKGINKPIDYVLCIGHFLGKDEDIYSFFEPELPVESPVLSRAKAIDAVRMTSPTYKSGIKSFIGSHRTNVTHFQAKPRANVPPALYDEGVSVLDLQSDNYFSCAVGRKHSNARYLLGSSEDVVLLMKGLAEVSSPCLNHAA
ncbi:alpha,alpha-trehalose-phosphate synthase [UDP-forming] 1-like isoform X2 [Silene latifolia]|uniref:alpha,alpha-trehalose-phosphate synthase [UDP-forming] 1-like isoform X2 n=1 Tax=Silene latifolia TaxID=37657 RepID=UPI003D77107B